MRLENCQVISTSITHVALLLWAVNQNHAGGGLNSPFPTKSTHSSLSPLLYSASSHTPPKSKGSFPPATGSNRRSGTASRSRLSRSWRKSGVFLSRRLVVALRRNPRSPQMTPQTQRRLKRSHQLALVPMAQL